MASEPTVNEFKVARTATRPKLSPDDLDDLIYCARAGDIQELQATIKSLSQSHSSAANEIITAAIDSDAEDSASSSGCSLLHWAAANNHEDILNYLLTNIGALPPMGEAIANGASTEMKQFKPANSGLVNHQNVSGNTPLHWAALNGNLECVKFLIRAGADPSIRNAAGHDAVFEAERGELNKNGPPPSASDHEAEQTENGEASEQPKTTGVVDWLLENCEGLDTGVAGQGEAAAAQTQSGENSMDVTG